MFLRIITNTTFAEHAAAIGFLPFVPGATQNAAKISFRAGATGFELTGDVVRRFNGLVKADQSKALEIFEKLPKKDFGGNVSKQLDTAIDAAKASVRGADWFDDVAKQATRNADSTKLVLGHFATDGTTYQKVAAHYKATYFKVENWSEVTKGLSPDEIWRINKTFLTQQMKQGKQILFSHNPLKARPNSFFEREVDFLRDLGYKFRQKDQWTWEAYK